MRAVFEAGADLVLVEDEKEQGVKNRLDLNIMPIFIAADFATEEMCSFQDRSDATETPSMNRLPHIFRVFEPKRISGRFLFTLLEIKQHLVLFALKLTKF